MRKIIINIMVLTIIVLASQTAINAQTPSQATATANVANGFLIGVTITDSGYGYTNVPLVHIIGGEGSNAIVTASISNSAVTSITINNPGAGYNTTPLVSIAPPYYPPLWLLRQLLISCSLTCK